MCVCVCGKYHRPTTSERKDRVDVIQEPIEENTGRTMDNVFVNLVDEIDWFSVYQTPTNFRVLKVHGL